MSVTISLPSSRCSTMRGVLADFGHGFAQLASLQSNFLRHQLTSRGSLRSISPLSRGTVSKT